MAEVRCAGGRLFNNLIGAVALLNDRFASKLTRDMGALKARLDMPERELAAMRDSLALPKRVMTTRCRRAGFSGVCAAAMPYVAARATPWALVPVAPRCAMQLLRVGDLAEKRRFRTLAEVGCPG